MKCLVSGATGFIGRALCTRLSRGGHDVVALSRYGAILAPDSTTHAVDLAAQSPPAQLLADVECVIHLAAIAHRKSRPDAYHDLNVEGTRRLAQAAVEAGVSHFVFVSSVKAMGDAPGEQPRREGDTCLPTDPYGLSKWQAEEMLRREFATFDSLAIVRPALVYGAGAGGNLQRLARATRRGLPRPPALGARSMIALDDLVELLLQLVLHPQPGVNTWIACESANYSARDIYDVLRQAANAAPGSSWLPLWCWRVAAHLLDVATGQPIGATYDKLFGFELYDNSALRTAIDWSPQLTLAEVMAVASGEGT